MNLLKLKILLFLFILPFFAQADIIKLEDAERTARNFYSEKSGVKQQEIFFENIISYKKNKEITYYIFDVNKDGGFIIISAEDEFSPVIAYSIKSEFKLEGIPEHINGLYQEYSEKILFVRNNNIKASDQTKNDWEKYNVSVDEFIVSKNSKGILLTTADFNQSGGFDDWVPFNEEGIPPTGCVATAMAIIMKYWNYPIQGTGSTSYYEYPYGTLSANFGESHYFWNLMDNDNSGNTFEAHLQYHCGVAVHMDYGLEGSGAYVGWGSNSALLALENYFNYKTTANFKEKSNYTDTQWKALLTTEIDAGRPMLYRGINDDGGHAWVCDGYNDSDLFHYNFGWGGYNNGYYDINNVNGFTDDNCAIMNIEPDGSNTYQNAPSNLTAQLNIANVDDFTVDLTWDTPENKVVNNYKIFRIDYDSEGFDNTFNEITILPGNVISYTDSDAEPGNKEYLVQAIHSDGEGYAINDYTQGAFYITFRVHDADGNLISNNGLNAQVIFNGETNICGFGSTSFQNVPFGASKFWQASADGHPTTSGLVDIIQDEVFNINLDGSFNGISEVNSNEISIYPNPTKDFLYINVLNINDDIKLEIFDISGKHVKSIIINATNSNIDLSDLPEGFYLLEFNINKDAFVKKIIKK